MKYLILLLISISANAGWYSQAEIDTNKARYTLGLSESLCIKRHGSCREYSGDIQCVVDNAGTLEHSAAKCVARDNVIQAIVDAKNANEEDKLLKHDQIVAILNTDWVDMTANQKQLFIRALKRMAKEFYRQ